MEVRRSKAGTVKAIHHPRPLKSLIGKTIFDLRGNGHEIRMQLQTLRKRQNRRREFFTLCGHGFPFARALRLAGKLTFSKN
jgi:hypothetical protein